MKYTPLDEFLSRPRIRIMRILRRADWMDSFDLYEACGAGVGSVDRVKYSAAIGDSVQCGEIERRAFRGASLSTGKSGAVCQYRLAAYGLAKLTRMLADAQPDIADYEVQP